MILYTWRCVSCSRVLAKLVQVAGMRLEIKCGCNVYNTLSVPADLVVREARLTGAGARL